MTGTRPERRYGGLTRQERRDERRTRLLDAGLELFAAEGFGATTIEMLCASTRLNPRYFYEEFGTREALLRDVYDRATAEVAVEVLAAFTAAPLQLRAKCDAGIRAFARALLSDPRKARIAYVEVVGVSAELEAHRRKVLRENAKLLAGITAELVADGQLPDRDYKLTALALMGAADELVVDFLADRRASRRGLVEELVELFVAALGRPA